MFGWLAFAVVVFLVGFVWYNGWLDPAIDWVKGKLKRDSE